MMPPVKFLHVADIHLDSGLKGLDQHPGAPVELIRTASRRALTNLVRFAIQEEVSFVLIAGDLYDGDWRDGNTGLFFNQQMHRLREAGIPVYLIRGNHDAQSEISRTIRLADNVKNFQTDAAETVTLEHLGIAIHGQGFATRAVTKNLSKSYPKTINGLFNIGLLHTSMTGREGHENYAPCSVEGLREKGYQYWALGHVHTRETVCAESNIIFPGNLQGRHIRETGEKGAMLVTVSPDHQCEIQFVPFDVMRWEHAVIEVTDLETVDDIYGQIEAVFKQLTDNNPGHLLAMRVTLNGATNLHHELNADHFSLTDNLKAVAQSYQDQIWIEKLKVKTSPKLDPQQHHFTDGVVGTLMSFIDQIRKDPEALKSLGCDVDEIRKKLPVELRSEVNWDQSESLTELIGAAESRLIQNLKLGQDE